MPEVEDPDFRIRQAIAAAMSPLSREAAARGKHVHARTIVPIFNLTGLVGSSSSLQDLVSSRDEWHADIFHDGEPAESVNGIMRDGMPIVQAVRTREDQQAISRALQRMHDAHPHARFVRLLISRRHNVSAIWAQDGRHDIVVCAHVPKAFAPTLQTTQPMSAKKFLEGLQARPPIPWKQPSWPRRLKQARFGKRSRAWGIFTLCFLALMIGLAWAVTQGEASDLPGMFLISEAILLLSYVVAGYLARSRFDGVLVDELNKISLARFQVVVWSIVILGSYYVGCMWDLVHGAAFPKITNELLGVMGIVGGVPVVSNVIKDTKKNALGPQQSTASSPSSLPVPTPPGAGPSVGSLTMNVTMADASWSDLYLGEEVANQNVIDVSRLQKLVFTTILVIAYITLAWTAFSSPSLLSKASGHIDMPVLDNGFVWLLAISNAAYLASKATPKTPVAATL